MYHFYNFKYIYWAELNAIDSFWFLHLHLHFLTLQEFKVFFSFLLLLILIQGSNKLLCFFIFLFLCQLTIIVGLYWYLVFIRTESIQYNQMASNIHLNKLPLFKRCRFDSANFLTTYIPTLWWSFCLVFIMLFCYKNMSHKKNSQKNMVEIWT